MWTPWIVLITYIKTFLCNSSFKLENEAFSILQLHFQNRNLLYLYIYCCNLVDTVESKVVLNGGNLGFVFSLRRESQNTANSHKNTKSFCHIFRNEILCQTGIEWFMNKPLCGSLMGKQTMKVCIVKFHTFFKKKNGGETF